MLCAITIITSMNEWKAPFVILLMQTWSTYWNPGWCAVPQPQAFVWIVVKSCEIDELNRINMRLVLTPQSYSINEKGDEIETKQRSQARKTCYVHRRFSFYTGSYLRWNINLLFLPGISHHIMSQPCRHAMQTSFFSHYLQNL